MVQKDQMDLIENKVIFRERECVCLCSVHVCMCVNARDFQRKCDEHGK